MDVKIIRLGDLYFFSIPYSDAFVFAVVDGLQEDATVDIIQCTTGWLALSIYPNVMRTEPDTKERRERIVRRVLQHAWSVFQEVGAVSVDVRMPEPTEGDPARML